MNRRYSKTGVRSLLLVALLLGSGCARSTPPPIATELAATSRIDLSLQKAARFLLARQMRDGTWRSDTYGAFKDGTALTPLVVRALQGVPPSAEVEAALAKGVAYLTELIRTDDPELSYPLYTTANAIVVLAQSNNEAHRKARIAWVKYLRQRQLTEDLGWQPQDKEYGGWGYCIVQPFKPKPGEFAPALTESNLSATLFALEALRSAGVPADDPILKKALVFVQRCQNYVADAKDHTALDDGGFYLIYDDPVRNKAGVAAADGQRYNSYGSMTADGLRALLHCGLPEGHERVRAARRWLTDHFTVTSHPGNYEKSRANQREAVFYYYSASLALGWQALGVVKDGERPGSWLAALAEELMKRQSDDGSWMNPVDTVRENDELTATALATIALGVCRAVLRDQSAR